MGQQHSSRHPKNSNNTGTPPHSNVVQNGETRSQLPNSQRVHRIFSASKAHSSAKGTRSNPPVPQGPPPRYRQTPEIAYVLRVAQHLDPVSRISLKYTNKYLYRGLEYTIVSELGCPKPRPKPSLGPNSHSIPGEAASQERTIVDPARERRLRLLRLLLKDGLFGDGKSICAPCLSVHEDSLFLPSELEKSDRERKCLGFTGKVWLCPHLQLDYDQVHSSKLHPSRSQPGHSETQSRPNGKQLATQPSSSSSTPTPGYSHRLSQPPSPPLPTPQTQTCSHCTSIHVSFATTSTTTTKTTTTFPLSHLPPSLPSPPTAPLNGLPPPYTPHPLPHPSTITALLARINAPLCPHIRTSDERVGAAYEWSCEVLGKMGTGREDAERVELPVYCGCRACRGRGGGACGACGVRWGFEGRGCWCWGVGGKEGGGGREWRRILRLVVVREVGNLAILDEKWRAGLVQPDIQEAGEGGVDKKKLEMEGEWKVAVGVCRVLMHVDVDGGGKRHRKECRGCLDRGVLAP